MAITEQEYRALSPEKKAALVAEHVMGECVHNWQRNGPNTWHQVCSKCGLRMASSTERSAHYSEDIAAAWQVVLRLKSAGWKGETRFAPTCFGEKEYGAWFRHPGFDHSDRDAIGYYGDSDVNQADAICLAALKAKGVVEG